MIIQNFQYMYFDLHEFLLFLLLLLLHELELELEPELHELDPLDPLLDPPLEQQIMAIGIMLMLPLLLDPLLLIGQHELPPLELPELPPLEHPQEELCGAGSGFASGSGSGAGSAIGSGKAMDIA